MSQHSLHDYVQCVGEEVVDELAVLASHLRGKTVQNINSTAVGGGVAEILLRMVPILNELGLKVRWDVIKGDQAFFDVTKSFHNALHGRHCRPLDEEMKAVYDDTTRNNLNSMAFDSEITFVHDPQPAGLIKARRIGNSRWIWRCHIDLSTPNREYWDFLSPIVGRYDASVFSSPAFAQTLSIPQFLISPSIDPLSDKNCELAEEEIASVMERFGIDRDRPIITQISRFDYLKDPVGVIDAYRIVRKSMDCRLVLAGGSADDDPEGAKVLAEVREKAGNDPCIHVLALPPTANREINALQRASTIVVQKSVREGFGLTVAEALWKGKPVVATAVGGIPLQVRHKVTGMLVHSTNGAAQAIKHLLAHPEIGRKMGANGREHVRQNFLLTRHVRDYLLLFLAVENPGRRGVIYL